MSPTDERKYLTATLNYLEKPAPSWSWSLFFTEAFAWLILAVVALWIVERPGNPPLEQIVLLVGAFLAGGFIGIVGVVRNLGRREALIRRYIDKEPIRARLSELGA